MIIHNCHTHVFTIKNVPKRFLPLGMASLLRFRFLRRPLGFLLRNLWPFSDRDLLDRYVRFINITYRKSQQGVFELLMGFYPAQTKFVVLPMDMAYMGAGKIEQSLEAQHQALAEIKQDYPDRILPFVAVDPRRPEIQTKVVDLIENHGFAGVKLYPPLGYYPFDDRLRPIYAYAEANRVPVLTHCSRGGVYYRGKITKDMLKHPRTGQPLRREKHKAFTDVYTDPDNYVYVLDEFPNLKLCLAHFGGGKEWEAYLAHPWSSSSSQPRSWLSRIADLIRSGKYPNLYTDISSTLHEDRYLPLLKVLLQDPALRTKVLFGTDFYLVEREIPEREFSVQLRAAIGEDDFRQIAETNPVSFLP